MEMKSVSIPIELHTWLYKNVNTDRKSLYAVIEWLRDCKEHSDRGGSACAEELASPAIIRKAKLWDDLKYILMNGTWSDEATIAAVITQMENIEASLPGIKFGSEEKKVISTTNTTRTALFRFVGDKPKLSEYVEAIADTGQVRTTHDRSKAIGFRLFDPVTREPDQVLISFDVLESPPSDQKQNVRKG